MAVEIIGSAPRRPVRRSTVLALTAAVLIAGAGVAAWANRDMRYELRPPERIDREYVRVGPADSPPFLALAKGAGAGPGIRGARGFNVDYLVRTPDSDRPRGSVMVDAAWGDVRDPGAAVTAALARVEAIPGYTLGAVHRPAHTPEGAVLRCATVHTGTGTTTACAWGDRDTVGVLLGPDPAQALRIRRALRVEGD